VAPGLWLWRVEHPDWRPEVDWGPLVTSTCVTSGGEVGLLDPLAPPEEATEVWGRLDATPPTLVVVLKPDHIRDVDVFVGRNETPLWLPEQRALVFADALTAPAGELRVWSTPWHEERALPALRALLELPFERVIVSHGEPVHDRAAYERALDLAPWSG
jgi:glyoxylase-like metal-dependent hydrolase (beta-lactamase superfamily II)